MKAGARWVGIRWPSASIVFAAAIGLVGLLVPGAFAEGTPAPLPGYPSCDYSKWRVPRVIRMGADTTPYQTATWSPDGKRLALGADIYNWRTGKKIGRIPFKGGYVEVPQWSPDGRTIAFSSDRGNTAGGIEGEFTSLWAYDLPTGKFSRLTNGIDGGADAGATFSPDSGRLTWTKTGLSGKTRWIPMIGKLVRHRDGTYALKRQRPLVPDDPSDPGYGAWQRVAGFTADGKGVIVDSTRSNAGNADAWRIDLATGKWTNLTNSTYWEEAPAVSPNGQKISFNSTRDYPWAGNTGLEVSRMLAVPSRLDNLLIAAYAVMVAPPIYAMSAEEYLANPDGTGQQSITFNTRYGIQGGWYSGLGAFSQDGTRLAFTQVAETQVRVPGMPANMVEIRSPWTNSVTRSNNWYRLVIVGFDCTHRVQIHRRHHRHHRHRPASRRVHGR